jgi:LuxR family transcriptional regulator, quorum-sensing system regulator BjaR1
MGQNTQNVLGAIQAIEQCGDSRAIVDVFADFVRNYGFETLYIAQLVNPANVPDDRVLHITNWPKELLRRRAARSDGLNDPVVRCGLRSRRPFTWSEAKKTASISGRRTLDEVSDFAMKDGLMFPMHAIGSVPGGVSLGTERLDVGPRDIAELEIVAQHTYFKLEDLLGPFPYQVTIDLSRRELEVVQIAAAGKTNWEISRILGVSEETVKATISRASKKLNASNRAHAVANAIAHSLIMP